MAHQNLWGGSGRCCHAVILAVHALTPPSSPYTLGFIFMAHLACVYVRFLSAYDREEPHAWGGWAGTLHDVEWFVTRAMRYKPNRQSEGELA